jgi:hypothetical protein
MEFPILAPWESPLSTPEIVSNEGYQQLELTNVKLDPYHAMARIPIPIKHSFHALAQRGLMLAIFKFDPKYVDIVSQVIQKEFGITFEEMMNVNLRWIQERVPRKIPSPSELTKNIQEWLKEFKKEKYIDSKTNKPLINKDVETAINQLLQQVRRGYLSDPVHTSLYIAKKNKDKYGLTLFRYLRGTSSLEGSVHQKVKDLLSGYNCGPEYACAALSVFRNRYNIRMSEQNRPDFPHIGHYEHYYIDLINSLTEKIYKKKVIFYCMITLWYFLR